LDLFDAGQTICLTGPGGTGKSLLIKEMYMRARKNSKKISVTALTGCAAYLLVESKARTIHSWSGVYRFNDREVTRSTILKYIQLLHKKRTQAMKRWLSTDILIIDEISMMSASFLTLLDGIGRELRSQGSHDPELRKKPFGGIQLIFVGDFL
jgi:nucleoside-triphosphatase THEP1